jgi:hypothetical protein
LDQKIYDLKKQLEEARENRRRNSLKIDNKVIYEEINKNYSNPSNNAYSGLTSAHLNKYEVDSGHKKIVEKEN